MRVVNIPFNPSDMAFNKIIFISAVLPTLGPPTPLLVMHQGICSFITSNPESSLLFIILLYGLNCCSTEYEQGI
jgi:hypothetical protein